MMGNTRLQFWVCPFSGRAVASAATRPPPFQFMQKATLMHASNRRMGKGPRRMRQRGDAGAGVVGAAHLRSRPS